MLFSVEGSRPVSYRLHDSAKPLLLPDGRGHVLYQRSNSFSVGQLHYTLEFADFNDDLYRRFVDEGNTLLKAFGLPDPHPALSAICRFQDSKRGLTITHGTLSTGKFGIVSAGVTIEHGEPVAIKQHRADTPHDMRRIRGEADIGALFKLQQGLMPTLSVWCEHQSAGVCNHIPQAIFTSSPLALCDFTRVLWSDYSLTVIRFMHRDIRIKYVFLVSSDPPAAVLGDFGKTVQAESHSHDFLGPIHTRAPEVDGRTQYTNKIDVWSLGIVLLSILVRDAQPPSGQIPTSQWYQPVMEYCTRVKRDKNDTLDADVSDLIQQMLTWDLNARPTARQIFEHPYFTSDHLCYDGTNAQPIPLPPPVSPQYPTRSIQPVPALAQVTSLTTQSAPRPGPHSAPQVFPSSSSSSSSLNIPMPAPYGRRPVSSVQAQRGQAPTTQGSFRQAHEGQVLEASRVPLNLGCRGSQAKEDRRTNHLLGHHLICRLEDAFQNWSRFSSTPEAIDPPTKRLSVVVHSIKIETDEDLAAEISKTGAQVKTLYASYLHLRDEASTLTLESEKQDNYKHQGLKGYKIGWDADEQGFRSKGSRPYNSQPARETLTNEGAKAFLRGMMKFAKGMAA
ncbi:MAG: hypothetical protein Q9207_005946 [Kuettlingeria erythrocarpa]